MTHETEDSGKVFASATRAGKLLFERCPGPHIGAGPR